MAEEAEDTTYVENPLQDADGDEIVFAHDMRNLVYSNDGAIVFAKFLGGVFLVTLSSFVVPIPDACNGNQPVGEWPTEQSLFYLSILPGVMVMFAPIPIFAYVLTANFKHSDEVEG